MVRQFLDLYTFANELKIHTIPGCFTDSESDVKTTETLYKLL